MLAEKVCKEKSPTNRLTNEDLCDINGDERHGYELSEEKGPTTANKMHMP